MIVLEQFVFSDNVYMLKRTGIFFVNQVFLSFGIFLVDRSVSPHPGRFTPGKYPAHIV